MCFYIGQGKNVMMLKGDATGRMEIGQTIKQKEEGNSLNLPNMVKSYPKGGKGNTNQIVQDGGKGEAGKK